MSPEMTFFTTAEAAALLRLKSQTLRKWRMSGEGPKYVRLGRRLSKGRPVGTVLYSAADLSAFLTARKFAHTSEETFRGQRETG